MFPSRRSVSRVVVATATVATGLLAIAAPAWAHVEAESVSVAPDGAAVVNFEFSHGCDGQATTGLRIEIPEGVTDVVPRPADGWVVAVSPTEFGWSGGSVPDHDKATFTVDLQVSGQAGTVISFPTIQQCGTAEVAWVEIAPPGEPEPELVAPSITLDATIAAPATTVAPATTETPRSTATTIPSGLATTTTLAAGAMPESTETNTGGLIVGLVTVAIIAGGALLLYLRTVGRGPPHRPKPMTLPRPTVSQSVDRKPHPGRVRRTERRAPTERADRPVFASTSPVARELVVVGV